MEPVRAQSNLALLGLGKQEEDQHFSENAAAQRRALAVEIEETADMRAAREVNQPVTCLINHTVCE